MSCSLQFTYVRSFACKARLQNLRADCSTVALYRVTITWPQIFKGSFRVTTVGVFFTCDCWTQISWVIGDSGKPRSFILCGKKHECIWNNACLFWNNASTSLKNPLLVSGTPERECITMVPPPCPLKGEETGAQVPLHNSIISNFIICQDRLETNLLQLFART